MPFDQGFPHPFTSGSVRAYAPGHSGVYGISNAREWLYIGQADNIQAALLDHLMHLETSLMRGKPAGFVFELCEQQRRASRQDRLVLEYEPTCNRFSWR